MNINSNIAIIEDLTFFEIIEFKDSPSNKLRDLYIPMNPYIELVINRTQGAFIKRCASSRGFIKTPHTNTLEIKLQPDYHFIVIRLKPTIFYQLFGEKGMLKKNMIQPIDDLPFFTNLQDIFFGTDEIDESKIFQLDSYIKSKLKFVVSPSTIALLNGLPINTMAPIYQVYEELGIDMQKYQKVFTKEVGISPKQFQIICRENKLEAFFSQRNSQVQLIHSRLKCKKRILGLELELSSPYATVAYARFRDQCLFNNLKNGVEEPESLYI